VILTVLCPLAALLAAIGLHRIAPRRAPGLYLWPAACTVILLALPTAYVATIWSH
jgi:predicted permease